LKPEALVLCLLAGATLCAPAGSASAGPAVNNLSLSYFAPNQDAVREIRGWIEAGNCKGAVEGLKPGLKAKQPDVLLLAGVMFDEGLCVAPNWDKAAGLYMLADEAGNKSGIPRLVAGYAKPGRDPASALWWAAKWKAGGLPAACRPKADPDADQQGFNDELARMPAQLFQECVYLAGVAGEMAAQLQFPPTALMNGVAGTVVMEFNPARGSIVWRQEALEQGQPSGVRDMNKVELDDPRAIKNSLLAYLKARGEFALGRYKRPEPGLDPDYVYRTKYVFEIN
jgi:TPR repeat protein